MRKHLPLHIPHTFRLVLAILPAVLVLVLVTAVPAVAAGAPPIGKCDMPDSCDVAEVGATSVVLEPSIKANGYETEYRLGYATVEAGPWAPVPEGSGLVSAAEGEKTLHVELTGLSPETTYYVRVVAQNTVGTTELPITSFTTESSAPLVVGTTVLSITESSAEVQGQLKPHLETQWRLEYATVEAGPWTTFASGTLAASDKLQSIPARDLTGLSPETTYYVREFLTNEAGEATSPLTSFETAGPPATSSPSIESESATSITEHGATLEAQINPGSSETTYEFWREYAVCQGSGVHCGSIAVGPIAKGHITASDQAQTVSVELTDLHPNYSYTYWVVATNSAGMTKAPDQEFQTLPEGTPPKASEEPLASPSGGDQPSAADDGAQPAGSSVLLSPPLARVDVSSPHMMTTPTVTGSTAKLARALKVCEKRPRSQRARCERQAYNKYAKTAKDTGKKASKQNRKKRRKQGIASSTFKAVPDRPGAETRVRVRRWLGYDKFTARR